MSADAGAAALIARMAAEGLLVTAATDAVGRDGLELPPAAAGAAAPARHARAARSTPCTRPPRRGSCRCSSQHGDMATALRHATHLDDRRQLVQLLSGARAGADRERRAGAGGHARWTPCPTSWARGTPGSRCCARSSGARPVTSRRPPSWPAEALALGAGPDASPQHGVGSRRADPACWLARTGLLPATDAIAAARQRLEQGALDDGRPTGANAAAGAADRARAWLLIELARRGVLGGPAGRGPRAPGRGAGGGPRPGRRPAGHRGDGLREPGGPGPRGRTRPPTGGPGRSSPGSRRRPSSGRPSSPRPTWCTPGSR